MDSADKKRADYDGAIAFLFGLQKYGIKLGLDNTLRLLSLLDNPQGSFKSIHIAGTNGKGSTSAMIASILKAAGLRVGLFTSPHLVSFTERIRVNDIEITEAEVVELTKEIRGIIVGSRKSEVGSQGPDSKLETLPTGRQARNSKLNPTFFEFVTAMAFLHFRRRGIEWAVIETGLGGRLDATNILAPEVCAITNISYDHAEFLGETLREIAAEKAGIIKEGVPVASSTQEPEAMRVIYAKAEEKRSRLFVYGKDFVSRPRNIDMHGITFDYEGRESLDDLRAPLCGIHQVENASLAIKTLELIMEKEPITYAPVREGLAHARWPGRLELMKNAGDGCDILIDGAHNPAAAKALAESLREYFAPFYDRIILILGMMADKDTGGIMRPLLPLASEITFCAPDYARAASPEKLAADARTLGFESAIMSSVGKALDLAINRAAAGSVSGGRALIVITGSFYTIGEAKAHLGHEGILARLRE